MIKFVDQYHRRSRPPGVDIVADEKGVDLVIGGVVMIGFSCEQGPLLFAPEIIYTEATQQGPQTRRLSLSDARVALSAVFIVAKTGEKILLGEELLAVLIKHRRRFALARAEATLAFAVNG